MLVNLDKVLSEFGAAFRRLFDAPLQYDEEDEQVLRDKAADYTPARILAMWIDYLETESRKGWHISLTKFLTDDKLNTYAVRLKQRMALQGKVKKDAEHRGQPEGFKTRAEVIHENIQELKLVVANVPEKLVREVMGCLVCHAWYYDQLGMERPAELKDAEAWEPHFPVRIALLVLAIKDAKTKGIIEWDGVFAWAAKATFLKRTLQIIKGPDNHLRVGIFPQLFADETARIEIKSFDPAKAAAIATVEAPPPPVELDEDMDFF